MIDFHNSIGEHEEILEGDNCLLFSLQLGDDEYEELYERVTSKDDFDYLLRETTTTFYVTANALLNGNGELDCEVILEVQDDENGWEDYEVPLLEIEKESLLDDMNRVAKYEHGTSLKELVEGYCVIEAEEELEL